MRRILYLFVFLFSFGFANAQKVSDSLRMVQYRIIEKVAALKDDSSKIKAIDSLISSGKITHDKYLAGLWSLRADILYNMYFQEIIAYTSIEEIDSITKDSSILQIINTILSNYNKAIETCTFCSPLYIDKRKVFYGAIANDSLYDKDVEELIKYGYKPEHTYLFNIGVNYFKGKNDWLGFDISATSLFQRGYYLKNIDPIGGKRKKVGDYNWFFGASFLTLGYNQNLNIKAHEFTASLIQMTSPFFISITKFGALQSPTEKHLVWFYRPEIGIGNSFISVGYSYNLIFKKSERNLWENHLLVIKLIIPTFKLD